MTTGTNNTAIKLAAFAVAMFGFGYLMVPLYDVFCDVTGINGKTGEISQAEARKGKVDKDRLVTVEFDTNVHALPWDFQAGERRLKVHPGEIAEAWFSVENKSNRTIVGRAIPSVAPSQAAIYFNKTECFCFTEQTLQPGEHLDMVVRFVVDPELPEWFGALVLSYTFFEISEKSNHVISRKTPDIKKANI